MLDTQSLSVFSVNLLVLETGSGTVVLVVAFVGAQAVERLLDGGSWRSLEVKVDGAADGQQHSSCGDRAKPTHESPLLPSQCAASASAPSWRGTDL